MSRLELYNTDNQNNWDISVQPPGYEINCRVYRSITEIPFYVVISPHLPGPTTIDSPTALSPDADSATNPVLLRQRILIELCIVYTKFTETLAQQQVRYKWDFDHQP